jgi:hypothetical protein
LPQARALRSEHPAPLIPAQARAQAEKPVPALPIGRCGPPVFALSSGLNGRPAELLGSIGRKRLNDAVTVIADGRDGSGDLLANDRDPDGDANIA